MSEKMLFADGFEAAFLGIGTQFNSDVAVYDRDLVLLELCAQGMSYTEALE